ncbi:MAG: sodium-translocating pyrophosphatase [Candidatus Omnitrophica bacterium]|nr:sodium-translocating pyrophosphatase [Candidatus Omnitrophota bacterium]
MQESKVIKLPAAETLAFEARKRLFKKWIFVLVGMMAALGVYFVYSNMYGSNAYYDEAMENPSSVVLTSGDSADVTVPVYLGLGVVDIDETLAENLSLRNSNGVLVNEVLPNSPAAKAGLQRGDVIAALDNKTIKDLDRFKELLADVQPGQVIRLTYYRSGAKAAAYLTVEPVSANPSDPASLVLTASADDDVTDDWGVSLSVLTDQLRGAFGIPADVSGVVILYVEPGGPADLAGLAAGDVIVKSDQTDIESLDDLFDAIDSDKDTTALFDVYSGGEYEYVPFDTSAYEADDDSGASFLSPLLAGVNFAVLGGVALAWIPGIGFAGMAVALFIYLWVGAKDAGNPRMRKIARTIRSGAFLFLKKEYGAMAFCLGGAWLLLTIFVGALTGVAFLAGASASMLAGWIAIHSSTIANVRTTQAAKDLGISGAFRVALGGGAVTGLAIASLGILGISLVGFITSYAPDRMPYATVGFAFGASLVALFARVGGGIFTKSADVGADLVGKVEAGIPEDDPRNPGVIADNVGDIVGDTAGRGADLFESYAGSVISAIAIGLMNPQCVTCEFLPLFLIASGLIASFIGLVVARWMARTETPREALKIALFVTGAVMVAGSFVSVKMLFGDLNLFWVCLTGITCGILISFETEMFTSGISVHSIATASESGSASTIIKGFAVGLKSAILPIITVSATIFISFALYGLYGISIAAVSMLSMVGMVMTADAFGPIVDNASGIAELSGAGPKIRAITDELDAIGNTTAAVGKGFAIGSAVLTAMAFFAAYATAAGIVGISLAGVDTMIGLLIGAVAPFGIAALTMESVGRIAERMVSEIRRQFKSIRGLMEGKADPDVDTCIAIVTEGALKELLFPGIFAVAAPILVGFILGKAALGGFLLGAIITGVILGLVMSNAGAAWDNAKKRIEAGHHGGRGSDAHKASVIGDTVGDPFKDTAGPAMNILIKLMAVVSLIIAPYLLR